MKVFEHFCNNFVDGCLAKKSVDGFESIWALDLDWFEEPNLCRGGWSGVARYKVSSEYSVFIKRQENYCYRSWNNLFIPTPTFYREFKNLQKFTQLKIPTLDLLYFGKRKEKGKMQAILVTEELDGFLSLDSDELKRIIQVDILFRKAVIKKLAKVIAHMHKEKVQHGCLYEKHVFLKRLEDGTIDLRLIDLEKAKKKIFGKSVVSRDLDTLFRHSEGWSKADYMRFFLLYRGEVRLSDQSKKVLASFLKKVKVKVKDNKSSKL